MAECPFALINGNSFYCSCEQVFDPSLTRAPRSSCPTTTDAPLPARPRPKRYTSGWGTRWDSCRGIRRLAPHAPALPARDARAPLPVREPPVPPRKAERLTPQVVKLQVRIAVLNGYTALGILATEAVRQVRPAKGKCALQRLRATRPNGFGDGERRGEALFERLARRASGT